MLIVTATVEKFGGVAWLGNLSPNPLVAGLMVSVSLSMRREQERETLSTQ